MSAHFCFRVKAKHFCFSRKAEVSKVVVRRRPTSRGGLGERLPAEGDGVHQLAIVR
jgi:hypothetical protein